MEYKLFRYIPSRYFGGLFFPIFLYVQANGNSVALCPVDGGAHIPPRVLKYVTVLAPSKQ